VKAGTSFLSIRDAEYSQLIGACMAGILCQFAHKLVYVMLHRFVDVCGGYGGIAVQKLCKC
jgi:hypothetical protein